MAWDREIALGLDVLLKEPVDVMCSQRHGIKCLEEVHSSLLKEDQGCSNLSSTSSEVLCLGAAACAKFSVLREC